MRISFGCSSGVQCPHLGSVLSLEPLILSASPCAAPGRDRILFAGHQQGWGAQQSQVRALRRSQRLAGLGKAFRILTQMALAHQRLDGRMSALVSFHESPAAVTGSAIAIHSATPRKARAVPQTFARGVAGFADRAEERKARYPFRCGSDGQGGCATSVPIE